MRTDWDSYFMDIANTTAKRSTCDRASVGCVITKENIIISTGYNGSIHGEPHCDDVGHLMDDAGHCIRTIHAEQNAILHAERDKLIGSTAYVTHEPCHICSRLLKQAGVTRVVYLKPYPNKYNLQFINGMEWEQFKGEKGDN